jgi:hypothetical protein
MMPRGRPPAKTSIVDNNEILSLEEIRNEDTNLWSLIPFLQSDILNWLAKHQLVRNNFYVRVENMQL